MPHCSCNDVSLYYEVHGEGWPVLFISGLGGGSWSWYGQIPYFEKYYTTITLDNRGVGRSSMPEGPYAMKQFAEDILCLLDHLQIQKVYALGLSMGGMIAQELALLAPERIQALFLGCTHCGGSVRIPPPPDVLERFVNNNGLTEEQIIRKNLPFLFSKKCIENRPEVIAAYCQVQMGTPLQPEYAFRAQLAAIGEFDSCDRLSRLPMPTMIMTGTEDVLVPRKNAHLLAKRIHQAELVEIPGAGHALHAECRDLLNEIAHEFFRCHAMENAS